MKKPFWTIAALALVVAVGAVVWFTQPKPPAAPLGLPGQPDTQKPALKEELPKGYRYQAVTEGQLPEGFPEELIIYPRVTVSRAEDTVDGSGARHRVVEYPVQGSLKTVSPRYNQELAKLGWSRAFEQQVSETVLYSVWEKVGQQVELTLTQSGADLTVKISYVSK